jgi:hypothetical protein
MGDPLGWRAPFACISLLMIPFVVFCATAAPMTLRGLAPSRRPASPAPESGGEDGGGGGGGGGGRSPPRERADGDDAGCARAAQRAISRISHVCRISSHAPSSCALAAAPPRRRRPAPPPSRSHGAACCARSGPTSPRCFACRSSCQSAPRGRRTPPRWAVTATTAPKPQKKFSTSMPQTLFLERLPSALASPERSLAGLFSIDGVPPCPPRSSSAPRCAPWGLFS